VKKLCIFCLIVLISGLFCFTVVKAGENRIPEVTPSRFNEPTIEVASALTPATQRAIQQEEKKSSPYKADWLKRTTIGAIIESDQKPRYYIETVQPFYQSAGKKDTFFTHIRVSEQDEYGTYSAGVGYRRLLFNNNLLAGINTFFDYQDPHQHYRQGVGLEAIGKLAEFRTNGYFGLSPAREVEGVSTYEKARDGFDMELGFPLPYLPWMKVFGSYYWYDFREDCDVEGWKGRLELKPMSFLTLNLETYDDNKGSQEWRSDVRLTLWVDSFAPKDIFAALTSSFTTVLPEVDLKERTLDRVERNFQITVEKWSDKSSFSVQVGRS